MKYCTVYHTLQILEYSSNIFSPALIILLENQNLRYRKIRIFLPIDFKVIYFEKEEFIETWPEPTSF